MFYMNEFSLGFNIFEDSCEYENLTLGNIE